MATTTRAIRPQWLSKAALRRVPSISRSTSSFAHLQDELPKREIQPTFEDLSPQSSYRLDTTLADFLPDTNPPPLLPPTHATNILPIPHHIVYFEPSRRSSEMLPDGTNPDHAPGDPFPRRMWAGGRVRYNQDNPLLLDGSRGVMAEFIRNVTIKGKEGDEKVFVIIERRMAKATLDEVERLTTSSQRIDTADSKQAKTDLHHRVRQRLWRHNDEDFGPASILETRNIVFMRNRSKAQAATEASKTATTKILKPTHKPDYTHTITPDNKLLFRFSALTFNAHAIHLDPDYSRNVEGHRNLLFHGPLSYTFLLTLLRQQLGKRGNEVIKSIEYRNVAPLYCHEEVTFCGTQTGEHKWEVWAQGPEGGVAVKGSVVTEQGRIDKTNLGI
ncbi:Mesaconyl-C(4)-CoA hydratase [Fulvia fulva]|uniref:Mesaconyl-C(4)-CoA hydratase n=1 Tax=Passalora fulva TaxID=5499 RepID=A0A9Q8LJG8_PASFU|nr:Mesaconyl-C(4)-CoA hydratase [Fulvia fulva]KAK4621564.1 Mesaconyl-C(4)-CoA hydratase [Fulvia fulva]KAK4622381.1 Mesaconyl-C(4)-CoA hydratase [Fulvia fulva]UJO18551.1 Mesaconyl-C(4)-CoA hydratase [Fulvia fulva]WPV16337.1 Mesaconyl-C(4)-CoA hydratase [Fulvia fulva]WPV31189.1 Mesaconyl-C(4)-CoA hydratase [Fulvia fulva]